MNKQNKKRGEQGQYASCTLELYTSVLEMVYLSKFIISKEWEETLKKDSGMRTSKIERRKNEYPIMRSSCLSRNSDLLSNRYKTFEYQQFR